MSATYTFDFSSSSSASSPAAAVKGRHCASFSSTSSGSNTPYHHHHVRQLSAGQPANPESPWSVVSLANSTPATPGVAPAFTPTVAPLQTVSDVVRYRHNVQYNYTKPVSAGARGLSLCKALLPKDVEALTGGAPTPLPSTHLTSCIFYSHADLTAIGRTREANARLLATETIAASGAGTSAVFVGQLGHGLSSTQMLGVMAVLAPDAMLTCPEMHSLGRGIGMGKGSCHARVRTDTLVHAVNADRGCYHDREGVWIATCEAGRRQLFIFEELMKHYHNGVPTGRPLNLMTVSVASNQRLGLPSTRM